MDDTPESTLNGNQDADATHNMNTSLSDTLEFEQSVHDNCVKIIAAFKKVIDPASPEWRLVIDPRNATNETPLFFAARRGLDQVAKLLIDEKADPNTFDDEWQTPLICSLRAYVPH